MHVMTILGTRPEIIRLSRIIPLLESCCSHTLVHTGQNFDERLSEVFFDELGLSVPHHQLDVGGGEFGPQAGRIFERCGRILADERPDRLLVLGDTNSALAAIVAKRLGIPVFHMEAGNRCHDDRVPEEVNRRVIDHCSDILMPYTERSRDNLLAEGFPSSRIFVTGNPIGEVISHNHHRIESSTILDQLELEPHRYFLATLHRAENVDLSSRRRQLLDSMGSLAAHYDQRVIVSLHPRLRARMESDGVPRGLSLHSPFGFLDFVKLERHAFCTLSDSGTVQEECTLLNVPSVTLRDVTERPETLECGANMLTGAGAEAILRAVALTTGSDQAWEVPPEYLRRNVAETVVKLVTGYHYGVDDP